MARRTVPSGLWLGGGIARNCGGRRVGNPLAIGVVYMKFVVDNWPASPKQSWRFRACSSERQKARQPDKRPKSLLDDWAKTGQSDPLTRSGHHGQPKAATARSRRPTVRDGGQGITVRGCRAYLKAHAEFLRKPATGRGAGDRARVQGPASSTWSKAILKRLRSGDRPLRTSAQRSSPTPSRTRSSRTAFRRRYKHHSRRRPSKDDPRGHQSCPSFLDGRFHHLGHRGQTASPPSACRGAASTCWRRAPSCRHRPTSTPPAAPSIAGEEAFFGDVARFVKSDVLMRLRVSSVSPDGVMCFGSRDPEGSGPSRRTELLFFSPRAGEHHPRPGSTCRNRHSVGLEAARRRGGTG